MRSGHSQGFKVRTILNYQNARKRQFVCFILFSHPALEVGSSGSELFCKARIRLRVSTHSVRSFSTPSMVFMAHTFCFLQTRSFSFASASIAAGGNGSRRAAVLSDDRPFNNFATPGYVRYVLTATRSRYHGTFMLT